MSEVKVLSTHAVEAVLRALAPKVAHASGQRLTIRYDPANALKRAIENGAAFDVAIVTRPVIDELAAQGLVLRETCRDIARSGLGVAVRAGAPKPDIASPDAFKRALLAARSVVRSSEGTSGVYFEKLLQRLGIADLLRGKIVLGPSGRVAEMVARGEAELAVQQIPELLPVEGVDFAGPFPDALQLYTIFSAGVGAAASDRAAAAALVEALAAPSAAALFKVQGLEPIAC